MLLSLLISPPNFTRNHVIIYKLFTRKSITERQDRQNFNRVCVLFVICTCAIILRLSYMKNALIFNLREMRNFSYILLVH